MDNEKTGFIIVDKPSGPTSHDIIDKMRRITGIKKIGHAGTLDPFASGVLVVAIGRQATRNISNFVKLDKEYAATLRLGATTDTYDRQGKITQEFEVAPKVHTNRDIKKNRVNFIPCSPTKNKVLINHLKKLIKVILSKSNPI